MTVRVAYLGPQGTFSQEAALIFTGLSGMEAKLCPYPSIIDCAEAVEDGHADFAVVPLENSLEGSVHDTLDVLTTSLEMTILAELVLDIRHNLLVSAGSMSDVLEVFSHPQALAQCRGFLRHALPGAAVIPVLSTAEAASIAAKKGVGAAAIAGRKAAEQYGLTILREAISDTNNRTRFIVLGRSLATPDPPAKTSVLFSVKNKAGSLFRVLQAFAGHEVNLTRIESRPAKSQLGEYIFFVDLDGTPDKPHVKAALREAGKEAIMLKMLGSYPVLNGQHTHNEQPTVP